MKINKYQIKQTHLTRKNVIQRDNSFIQRFQVL
jgi:hypothetical protein